MDINDICLFNGHFNSLSGEIVSKVENIAPQVFIEFGHQTQTVFHDCPFCHV